MANSNQQDQGESLPATGGAPVEAPSPIHRAPRAPDAVRPPTSSHRAATVLATLAVLAALKLGRDILVPVVWAAFLSFAFAPVARRLEALRLHRGIAATIAVLVPAAILGGVLALATMQAVDLARRLPEYQLNLNAKFSSLASGGMAGQLIEAGARLKDLDEKLAPAMGPAEGAGMAGESHVPVPEPKTSPVNVRVVEAPSSAFTTIGDVLDRILGPLAEIAIIILLSIFFTAYHEEVRERVIRMGTRSRIGQTGRALEDAAHGVTRYLVSNVAVNGVYGLAVGASLHLIGLPNAALWAVMCALLRFIPYLGTWIGAALPVAVSIAVFPGWTGTLWVVGAILGIDILVGNVVEPLVYGHRTGLAPVIVVLATVFWTWMWGLTGIVLAVPLTLCLAVAGRYVPGLKPLHVLLGDEPVLDPSERAYDRLNAFDAEGAARVATEQEEKVGPVTAWDMVLVSALRRAERDRREGILDLERFRSICDGVHEALELLPAPAPAVTLSGRVLLVPVKGEADRGACEVLARLLEGRGVHAEIGPEGSESAAAVEGAIASAYAATAFVSLPPFAPTRIRYFVKKAKERHPEAAILGLSLESPADPALQPEVVRRAGSDSVTFGLGHAVDAVAATAEALESAKGCSEPAREPRALERAPLVPAGRIP